LRGQPEPGWPLKNWSPQRWGKLAEEVRRSWGLTPLVPGGPGEDALVAAVVEASRGSAHGLAGRLSVGALAALYRRASIVIGIDSGPIHLAVMVGAPVVGLYGPLDPLKWGPWCPPDRHRVIRVNLPCSPCDCIFDPPCGIPIEPPCCTGITVEAVLAAAEDLLNNCKPGLISSGRSVVCFGPQNRPIIHNPTDHEENNGSSTTEFLHHRGE